MMQARARELAVGALTSVLLAGGLAAVPGPTETASALTVSCSVSGARTHETARYKRTSGECVQVRSFIIRLDQNTGRLHEFNGRWEHTAYSIVTATLGYPYSGGFDRR